MANDERVDYPLLHGRTDGKNIPEYETEVPTLEVLTDNRK